jgi:hypothetical protein
MIYDCAIWDMLAMMSSSMMVKGEHTTFSSLFRCDTVVAAAVVTTAGRALAIRPASA